MFVPGPPGAHNWPPTSFSPKTGLVYIPTLNNAWPYLPKRDWKYVRGAFNTSEDYPALAEFARYYLPYCSPSHLTAWDPVSQKQVWRVNHDHPVNGGVLSTGGGLVFQGHGGGIFAAYAAKSGERLWQSEIGVGIMAPPVTYAVNGEQYIAVLAGIGGTPALNHVELDYVNDGRILAYKLGGQAALPPVTKRQPGSVDVPPLTLSPESLARGDSLFSTHCARCHGFLAQGTGFLPDLRHSPRAVHDAWDAIVLQGAFHAKGMASFADLIDAEDSRAIHGYVVSQALRAPALVDRLVGWARKNLCVPTSWVAD